MGPKLDIGTGSATLILDTVSSGPWYETIHGLNILINIGFLGVDIRNFYELYQMRKSWKSGNYEEKENVMGNPMFRKEIKLRDLIIKIRDTMMTDGY